MGGGGAAHQCPLESVSSYLYHCMLTCDIPMTHHPPEGYVSGHANQARITTWPRNTNDTLYAKDVVTFAQGKGLYPADGKEEDFSFSDIYDPVNVISARLYVMQPRVCAQSIATTMPTSSLHACT